LAALAIIILMIFLLRLDRPLENAQPAEDRPASIEADAPS